VTSRYLPTALSKEQLRARAPVLSLRTMPPPPDARYAFIVEWYDTSASLVRQYQLIYYSSDGTLEMFDLKNRRTFLKRMDYPGVTLRDLYKGATITVYSRQICLVDYADSFTATVFEKNAQTTVASVKASAIPSMGRIIDAIHGSGLTISELELFSDELVIQVTGKEVSAALASLMQQINAQLGAGSIVAAPSDAFTSKPKGAVTQIESSSLLLIRPHAVKEGMLGRMIDQVQGSGFKVLKLKMIQLTRPNSQEFLEVYRGVVPECPEWVEELASGASVAMQLVHESRPEATVLAVRELCGAHDPEIANHLHPHSLRAQYGATKAQNAVHCTDLPEDGPLEVDYVFQCL